MPLDTGTQNVGLIYHKLASSANVNSRFQGIRPLGIYSGGYLTVSDASHAVLSTFIAEVSDGDYQVRIETTTTVTITTSSSTPYIVIRWTYTGATDDFAEILVVATPAANDVVVAKCTFSGATLTGFNYADTSYPRTTPNTMDLFLKVQATADAEMRVRIRAGRIQTHAGVVTISDQKSNLFTAPASNSRIDLVYVNKSTGAIAIQQGTAAVSPTAPSYNGKFVLAEVTINSTDTNIADSAIKDVRPFLTDSIVPDGTTLDFAADGQLEIIGLPDDIVDSDAIAGGAILPAAIDSVFGAWSSVDSEANALAKTEVYRVTSDGFIFAMASSGGQLLMYTDSSNPPTTARRNHYHNNGVTVWNLDGMIPVRKNDYWKITHGATVTIYWLPLGSTGQCVKQ